MILKATMPSIISRNKSSFLPVAAARHRLQADILLPFYSARTVAAMPYCVIFPYSVQHQSNPYNNPCFPIRRRLFSAAVRAARFCPGQRAAPPAGPLRAAGRTETVAAARSDPERAAVPFPVRRGNGANSLVFRPRRSIRLTIGKINCKIAEPNRRALRRRPHSPHIRV